MSEKQERDGYWWCPSCKEELGWYHVTHQEFCEHCGHLVSWITIIHGELLSHKQAQEQLKAALFKKLADAHGKIERLRETLQQCRSLFGEIRGDWTDPRRECRAGVDIISAVLAPDTAEAAKVKK